jgi:glucokinase
MHKKYAIGIDLGGTNLRVGLVSEDGEIQQKIKEQTSEKILEPIFRAISTLSTRDVTGIGIGAAGLVDRVNRRILNSPNLQAVEHIDLLQEIQEKYKIPVFLENDANAAALGEMWVGAGQDVSSFVLFTLGTGIGGGIVCDGKLLQVSAEVGHMSIHAEGEKCLCGNYGCLESYASARSVVSHTIRMLETGRKSLLSEYHRGNIYQLTAEDIFKAALDGDIISREVWKNAGRYLGIGIANVINLMSPEAVILAGGLTGAWDIYVQEAIKEAAKRAYKTLFERVKIIPSKLMDDAGIIGAAGLVLHA